MQYSDAIYRREPGMRAITFGMLLALCWAATMPPMLTLP
jgi:hypothetical protein